MKKIFSIALLSLSLTIPASDIAEASPSPIHEFSASVGMDPAN